MLAPSSKEYFSQGIQNFIWICYTFICFELFDTFHFVDLMSQHPFVSLERNSAQLNGVAAIDRLKKTSPPYIPAYSLCFSLAMKRQLPRDSCTGGSVLPFGRGSFNDVDSLIKLVSKSLFDKIKPGSKVVFY